MTKKHKLASAESFGEAKKKEDYLENWKRERASFLNYKKEESVRIERSIKFANEQFVLGVLNILDNIYLAEENLPKDLKDNKWVEGILKTKDQILDFLRISGVKEIECLRKEFDPNFHEAIDIVKHDSKSGIIIEEINKGYTLHEKVIRPSRVRVSK